MSVYTECESVFSAFSTSNAIPYGAVEYDPGTSTLPDLFFIYRVVGDDDAVHFDNVSKRRDYRVQINMYMTSKSDLQTKPDLLDTAAIAAGWLPQGNGRDAGKLSTGHFGWTKDYVIPTQQ